VQRLRRNLRDISFAHVEGAVRIAGEKETGAMASLPGGLALTVGYETLTVADQDYVPALEGWPALRAARLPLAVPGRTPLPGPGGWQVQVEWLRPDDLPPDWDTNPDRWQAFIDAGSIGEGRLVLRRRHPGDRFQPQGMGGHTKSLSDFLINAKVPAAWRDRVPLLASAANEARILWVAGWRLDERARVRPETARVLRVRFLRK
jgi:tRNA(Ile)-lysidine synthase